MLGNRLLLLALVCLLMTPVLGQPAEDTVGCEANPTGNPIGGGQGYSPIFADGDYTVRTKEEFVAALQQAKAGQRVWLPGDVEINLTGSEPLDIPGGVTLASNRGLNGSRGARLFSAEKTNPMLRSAGEGVRVTGLRIEGPDPGQVSMLSAGVRLEHFGGEIDNCEVYNFGAVGVGSRACNFRVHHNYFHHCQGNGYGYSVRYDGSEARIYGNRFDFTRHAIAAGGSPGCGYEAAWNLVGPDQTSHAVDMHGGVDRGDGTLIAGDWMLVHHNTFLGPIRGVCLRGIPSQEARIYNNWFARDTAAMGGSPEVGGKYVYSNVYSWGNTLVYGNANGPNKTPQPAPYVLTVDCYFEDPDTHYALSGDLSFEE